MKGFTLVLGLAGVSLFGLGAGTELAAKTYSDSKHRVEKDRADVSGAPGMEVIASLAEYKPGESLDLHSHPGIAAASTAAQPPSTTTSAREIFLPSDCALLKSFSVGRMRQPTTP